MSESFIKKVAGYWLIKKRLRHSCFPVDCVKCFKNSYFEELLQIAENNDSKKYNNLFRENKPPAPTRIRKDNRWSICQLSCCYTSEYVQKNVIYQRPSFSRDLCRPIKFQVFCDQTINSPYIYAPKHQSKN